MISKQFGGSIGKDLINRLQTSENWQNGHFRNLEATPMPGSLRDIPRIIYKQIRSKKEQVPPVPLPMHPFNAPSLLNHSSDAKFIWFGHSVLMMRLAGKTIIIDPMFGPDTTPIAPMKTSRFSNDTIDLIDDFPPIDLVLITHDHYDHLDYGSIQKIKTKVKHFYVALGVKRHLAAWGVPENQITEFDWWEQKMFDTIQITFTPTRHFSGRFLNDRMKSLWGGWAFKTESQNIWFSGDGGYGKHFNTIGTRLGPFDIGFMECGQYNEDWSALHLFPEESVFAALDAGVSKAIPVHWGGFPLSYQHSWSEPVEDFVKHADQRQLDFGTPELGAIFSEKDVLQHEWWLGFK